MGCSISTHPRKHPLQTWNLGPLIRRVLPLGEGLVIAVAHSEMTFSRDSLSNCQLQPCGLDNIATPQETSGPSSHSRKSRTPQHFPNKQHFSSTLFSYLFSFLGLL